MKIGQLIGIFVLAACLALCGDLCVVPIAVKAQPQPIQVHIDGKTLPPDSVRVINDKTYIGLRPVAQALSADIAFDRKAKTLTITTLLRQVVFRLGDQWATVNGQRVHLDASPQQSQNRVLIPLRALSSAFGATIVYHAQSHSVSVVANPYGPPAGSTVTPPPVKATNTITGTVNAVQTSTSPSTITLVAKGTNYSISVPSSTRIEFRDIHGAVTATGSLGQVRPGDTLIITMDASGQVIAMADIFSILNGAIAAVSGTSLVLASGRVVSAEKADVSVTLDGKPADFSALKAGDKVSVRSDPMTGAARDIVALTPGGLATSGESTPNPANSNAAPIHISNVTDNADHAFRDGQLLRVQLDGTPGSQAQFDLSNVIIANQMRETRTGHYEGEYAVMVGTNLIDAPLIVHLSKNGQSATAEGPDALTIITTPPSVKETAPSAGDRISSRRPNIFAAFNTVGDKGMSPNGLQMTVNGRDVTPLATRTETYISYYPRADLPPGTVLVQVKGTDIAGNGLSYRWSFVISGK